MLDIIILVVFRFFKNLWTSFELNKIFHTIIFSYIFESEKACKIMPYHVHFSYQTILMIKKRGLSVCLYWRISLTTKPICFSLQCSFSCVLGRFITIFGKGTTTLSIEIARNKKRVARWRQRRKMNKTDDLKIDKLFINYYILKENILNASRGSRIFIYQPNVVKEKLWLAKVSINGKSAKV